MNTRYRITGYYKKPYRTQAFDTFDKIAFKLYGVEGVASHLIEANPQYSNVLQFEPDVLLKLPKLEEIEKSTLPQWKGGVVG